MIGSKHSQTIQKRPKQTLRSEEMHVFFFFFCGASCSKYVVSLYSRSQTSSGDSRYLNKPIRRVQSHCWTHLGITGGSGIGGGKLEQIQQILSSLCYLGAHLATSLFHLSALRSSAGDSFCTAIELYNSVCSCACCHVPGSNPSEER